MEDSGTSILIPEDWSDAIESITSSSLLPVAFICGPKNSGKTTFSGLLINSLLLRYKRVAYLDTDVGQPVFTPPGCLSLTIINEPTPDLTVPCLKTPERCYFFGDLSSKTDPELYMNSVTALYDYYTKVLCVSSKSGSSGRSELPLIINTPGWVKGIGYDLLVDMLKSTGPTHVVKIKIKTKESYVDKNLPKGKFWLKDDDDASVKAARCTKRPRNRGSDVDLIEIRSAFKDSNDISVLVHKEAPLIRESRVIAYFRKCFPTDMNITTNKELAHALACHPPYQVPIPRIKIRHLHCQVANTEVLYSLNATIVGVAVSPEDAQSLPVCVGLGIVRGIDVSRNLIYVITPVPLSILARVDLLLQGFIQIPDSLLQVKGCISPYMSTNVVLQISKNQESKVEHRLDID